MPDRLIVFDIIEKYIKENGFDGLVNEEDECGCQLGDLSEYSCMNQECEPAYNHGKKDGFDFWMCTEKPSETGCNINTLEILEKRDK